MSDGIYIYRVCDSSGCVGWAAGECKGVDADCDANLFLSNDKRFDQNPIVNIIVGSVIQVSASCGRRQSYNCDSNSFLTKQL